jgi:hypothetical protein
MSAIKAAVLTVQSREYSDYDDASSEYSTGANPSKQPLHDFSSPSTLIDENASPNTRIAMGKFWRHSIAARSRRKQSMDDVEEEVKEGLLGDSRPRRKSRKTKPWYICCIFSGLGCLTLSYVK